MRALKFTLSGKNAFFKKPEVNAYFYFTYGQIHRVALLGILGAIVGYKGYGCTGTYPEFYEKLKDLKVSVVPRNSQGYIQKKVQMFNNTVGYASQELGGNLIVREQWLENPVWDIYILLDSREADKIAEMILDKKCVYIPYMGKNDHLADICAAKVVELDVVTCENVVLSCLYEKKDGKLGIADDEEEEKLRDKAKELETKIEPRLLQSFKRIRKNSRNGLGIVYVQRDACGGCFNKIPPQRQLDIRSRKKIIVCEYCGRIMIDPELAGVTLEHKEEVKEKPTRRRKTAE